MCHIFCCPFCMTKASPQSLQPPRRYHTLLSQIIWLSIQRICSTHEARASRGRSYYLCSVTTQMVSQTERLMGIHVLFIAGRQIMTPAQVVKCTPVIVLHQADEITLFRWHPTSPAPPGLPENDMFCFSYLIPDLHLLLLPTMPFTTTGLR